MQLTGRTTDLMRAFTDCVSGFCVAWKRNCTMPPFVNIVNRSNMLKGWRVVSELCSLNRIVNVATPTCIQT